MPNCRTRQPFPKFHCSLSKGSKEPKPKVSWTTELEAELRKKFNPGDSFGLPEVYKLIPAFQRRHKENQHIAAPPALYRLLDAEFHFTLDGLSTLFKPWAGERVFCNPPYRPKIGQWLSRAPEADLAVFLIPARTDTLWFHRYVMPHASEIRFIRGRLKFGDATHAAPFASMLVIYQGWAGVTSMKQP